MELSRSFRPKRRDAPQSSQLLLLSLVLRPARSIPGSNPLPHLAKEAQRLSFQQELVAALAITTITEFIIFYALIRQDPSRLLLYSILINSFTNPLFNYLYNYQLPDAYLLEMLVVLAESVLLMSLLEVSYPKSLLISAAANAASYLIGLLLFP
jgi:hypothetical protein